MRTFREAIRHTDFAVSAEIFLRPELDRAALYEQAEVVRDHVDGILVTDNQYGKLHPSPIALGSMLLDHGVDPIIQIASRNRNRIALISDVLGARAIGATTLLMVAGEKAPDDFKPRPKRVIDLSATELIRTAATVNADERLSGPDLLIGGAVTPVLPRENWQPKKLTEKIDAGATFLVTHLCMDVDLLRRYARYLVDNKLIQRTSIIVTVAVLKTADDVTWLRENRPNVMLPDSIAERLAAAKDPRAEGLRICSETIAALMAVPGIGGVNVVAGSDLATIPAVLSQAGVPQRR